MNSRRAKFVSSVSTLTALGLVVAVGACSTVEDGWDSLFGSEPSATSTQTAAAEDTASETEKATAPSTPDVPAASALVGAKEPPPYADGKSRRQPTTVRPLHDEPPSAAQTARTPEPKTAPAAPAQRSAPPAQSQPQPQEQSNARPQPQPLAAPTPAPQPVMAKQVQPQPAQPPQSQVPLRPMQMATPAGAAPVGGGRPVLPEQPVGVRGGADIAAEMGTTIIEGDGRSRIGQYAPVQRTGGLMRPATGPLPMAEFEPLDTSTSTLVATIQFGHGSAALSSHDRSVLRQVVELQRRYGARVRVIGHASSRTGNMSLASHQMANFVTSTERAQSVAAALQAMGVPLQALTVAAVSDNEPLYYEVMPSGEAGNRRTEIYLDY